MYKVRHLRIKVKYETFIEAVRIHEFTFIYLFYNYLERHSVLRRKTISIDIFLILFLISITQFTTLFVANNCLQVFLYIFLIAEIVVCDKSNQIEIKLHFILYFCFKFSILLCNVRVSCEVIAAQNC